MNKFMGFAVASLFALVAGSGAARADHVCPPGDAVTGSTPGSALLVLNVPEDARVYLEDQAMRSTGSVRRYTVPRLAPGVGHNYTVRVEVERNGTVLSETVKTPIRAGQQVEVTARIPDDRPDELVMNVGPAAPGRETYRSFAFEPEPGGAAVSPPIFQAPAFQAPVTGGMPARRPADRIEQRMRPGAPSGSWMR